MKHGATMKDGEDVLDIDAAASGPVTLTTSSGVRYSFSALKLKPVSYFWHVICSAF